MEPNNSQSTSTKETNLLNDYDIVVYTTPEKLLHKQGKLPNDEDHSPTGDYYWSSRSIPKSWHNLDWDNTLPKMYVATKGFIKGYFILYEYEHSDYNCEYTFNCSTWKDIEPIPIKHFQGFKYANKVPELFK